MIIISSSAIADKPYALKAIRKATAKTTVFFIPLRALNSINLNLLDFNLRSPP
jgi:hypothetical protein